MRTIVSLPQEQIDALAEICRREQISRAEAIRRAIAGYARQQLPDRGGEAFGLWRDRGIDGLEYERRAREEWEC